MTRDKSQRCAHEACTCHAPEGDTYCSESCREAAASTPGHGKHECQCGHAGCVHSAYVAPKAAPKRANVA